MTQPRALEPALQLHLPTFKDVPMRELLELGRTAHAAGFKQLWVTDNLQSRNAFVVLAALATVVPIKLGTAVMVQYFRNPVDVADAVAAISELMEGREFGLGLARGNPSTGRLINQPKPVTFLREAAQCLGQLLDGQEVRFGGYPALASYFNFMPDFPYRLNFRPSSPVRLYSGGNGPLALDVAGRWMDGVVFGGTLQAAAGAGMLRELLATGDNAAKTAGRAPLRKVAEIKISVAKDGRAAREFVKHSVAPRILSLRQRGYTDGHFRALGVEPADVDRLQGAEQAGASRHELEGYVTEGMIDALFVAGDPGYCRERMGDVSARMQAYGFEQLMFSEWGPDVNQALRLLADEVVPAI